MTAAPAAVGPHTFMSNYPRLITSKPLKVIIVLAALFAFATNLWITATIFDYYKSWWGQEVGIEKAKWVVICQWLSVLVLWRLPNIWFSLGSGPTGTDGYGETLSENANEVIAITIERERYVARGLPVLIGKRYRVNPIHVDDRLIFAAWLHERNKTLAKEAPSSRHQTQFHYDEAERLWRDSHLHRNRYLA